MGAEGVQWHSTARLLLVTHEPIKSSPFPPPFNEQVQHTMSHLQANCKQFEKPQKGLSSSVHLSGCGLPSRKTLPPSSPERYLATR